MDPQLQRGAQTRQHPALPGHGGGEGWPGGRGGEVQWTEHTNLGI